MRFFSLGLDYLRGLGDTVLWKMFLWGGLAYLISYESWSAWWVLFGVGLELFYSYTAQRLVILGHKLRDDEHYLSAKLEYERQNRAVKLGLKK